MRLIATMRIVPACIIFSLVINVCVAQNINNLIAQAEENLEQNHWEQAANNFNSIIKNYEDDLTYHQRAKIYNNLGYLNLNLLDAFEAERNLNLSILYHEEAGIPNQKDYAMALLNMGILYIEQVEFDLARNYIQKSLNILSELPGSKTDYWIARAKLALLYEEAGSYTLALSIYNNCYDQLVASGNDLSPDFAEICMHKGRILILTGDPVEGEKFINLSSTIYESLGAQYAVERAESLEHLAIFYERMGRFGEAEKTLLEVLRLKRSIPDEADILIIETLNDLGIMYHRLGQVRKASQMFQEVISESEENVGTDHPFYATAKNNLGTLALASGDIEGARDLFVDALATYKAKFGVAHPYYANTLNNLARVERQLGNNEQAEKYYMEVLGIDEKIYGKNHPNYATTLINVGVLFSSIGREQEAERYYREAVDIRERVLGVNHPGYAGALEYMGMHSLAVGNNGEAESFFRKSIEIQIGQIGTLFPIMSEREREIFYEKIKANIDRYNYVASQLLEKQPELLKKIFDFQIKTKGFLFNPSENIQGHVNESDDLDLKAKFKKWQSDKRLLASYYQMGAQELAQQNVNLEYEESKVIRLEKELEEKLANFSESLHKVDKDWRNVQDYVKPGEAVIKLIRIREFKSLTQSIETLFGFTDYTRYLAIIFQYGQNEPSYVFLGADSETEVQHSARLVNSIFESKDQTETYDLFWRPIDQKLNNVNTVRVIPDGIFYKINPNALNTPNGGNLIDKYYVSYLTASKDLFRPEVEIFNRKSYLFGNPLYNQEESDNRLNLVSMPESENEIKGIEGVLSEDWHVRSHLREDANEFKIRSAYNPTVLHIDSHAFFNDQYNFIANHTPIDNPLFRAGIYLAGASETFSRYMKGIQTIPENDGILTTYEALNLDLSKTQLVVLPSCEFGSEDVENSDGIYGLQRAFIVAGARNIITSLSKIDDKISSELMILFYQKLNETNRVMESLKHAQLKLREKYSDPGVWGAFILTGNG
ncbi:CHAT domain-containing tetratricopeptide repeat protein [Ekhidna sp.]|uniref:CHAT domain-containing tetratricopeptide repeat protein n=1 Tax=Ekhidna sp. TaxID=2608089 RepID=UPI003299A50C